MPPDPHHAFGACSAHPITSHISLLRENTAFKKCIRDGGIKILQLLKFVLHNYVTTFMILECTEIM